MLCFTLFAAAANAVSKVSLGATAIRQSWLSPLTCLWFSGLLECWKTHELHLMRSVRSKNDAARASRLSNAPRSLKGVRLLLTCLPFAFVVALNFMSKRCHVWGGGQICFIKGANRYIYIYILNTSRLYTHICIYNMYIYMYIYLYIHVSQWRILSWSRHPPRARCPLKQTHVVLTGVRAKKRRSYTPCWTDKALNSKWHMQSNHLDVLSTCVCICTGWDNQIHNLSLSPWVPLYIHILIPHCALCWAQSHSRTFSNEPGPVSWCDAAFPVGSQVDTMCRIRLYICIQ